MTHLRCAVYFSITGMILFEELADRYFDLECRSHALPEELKFISGIFRERNVSRCLDIGCGSGEHAGGLARMGFQSSGQDLSPRMIEIARKKQPLCEFHLEDFSVSIKGGPYEGIFSLHGSFCYLLDNQSVLRAFQHAYSALSPGGVFILEVWHFAPYRAIGSIPFRSYGGWPDVKAARRFQTISAQVHLIELEYAFQFGEKRFLDLHTLRTYSLEEISALAGSVGFLTELISGDFQGGPFQENKKSLLIILRKPR